MPRVAGHLIAPKDADVVIYNGFDSAKTLEISHITSAIDCVHAQLAYEVLLGLQGVAMEMMLRGFRVDPIEREIAIERITRNRHQLDVILSKFYTAITDKPYNGKFPNSGKQLAELFYNRMQLKPIEKKDRKTGLVTRPMDRTTLMRLADEHFYAEPIANAVLLHRDLTGLLEDLETLIDGDMRWRTSYNITGTTTFRWSSSRSGLGTGCVLPQVQVLTPTGWLRIDEIIEGDLIAQWDEPSNKISFTPCKIHEENFSGDLLRVKTEQLQQTLTPSHRIPHYDSRMNYFHVLPASKVNLLSQEVIPLGAHYVGGTLEVPRYAAMLMADFNKETNGRWRASFTKQRKIDRLLALSAEFGFRVEEKTPNNGERRFTVYEQYGLPKKWGGWVLDLTPESAEDLVEEARYWDSHDRGSGFIFYTVDEDQATWFATLAHLVGRAATRRLMEQSEATKLLTPNSRPIWCINVKSRSHARVQHKHWSRIPYTGKVYCPQVQSSFWLMREDGFISITGNSNFQNITEENRRMFIADNGWKLCGIDAEQSEARDVGWFCGTVLDKWGYLNTVEAGDVHTRIARMCWPELAWAGDIKHDRQIADQTFYRHFSRRDATKRLGHGLNYLGKPTTMATQTKIPLNIVRPFQERYFDSFPEIPEMHTWHAEKLQRDRYIVNCFGLRRDFFDRPDSDETIRSAVAHSFQSATVLRVLLGGWRLWKYMGNRIQLLSQLHDAWYFQYRIDDDENDIIKEALNYMKVVHYHKLPDGTLREFTVPNEAQIGFNWAHRWKLREDGTREDYNPRGLDKWRGN